jgi:hypothetical protein
MKITAHDIAESQVALAMAKAAYEALPSPVIAGIRGFRPDDFNCDGIGWEEGPLFDAGMIVITAQADAVLRETGASLDELLVRYVCGDWPGVWGSLALEEKGNVYAAFDCGGQWVALHTTADRARTTVTTPTEYRTSYLPH